MKIAKCALLAVILTIAGGSTVLAQDSAPPASGGPGGMPEMQRKHMDEMMHGGGPHGRWWNDAKWLPNSA